MIQYNSNEIGEDSHGELETNGENNNGDQEK
jgi:hypothetical protein